MPLTTRWTAIAESQFPWEREALDYVRERLPDQEPYMRVGKLRVRGRRRQHLRIELPTNR